jgi:hypothetical protein
VSPALDMRAPVGIVSGESAFARFSKRVRIFRRGGDFAATNIACCAGTERTFDLVADANEVFVPALWPLEVSNALLADERRKRITVAQTTAFLNRISEFRIAVDPSSVSRCFGQVLSIARQYDLTEPRFSLIDGSAARRVHLIGQLRLHTDEGGTTLLTNEVGKTPQLGLVEIAPKRKAQRGADFPHAQGTQLGNPPAQSILRNSDRIV